VGRCEEDAERGPFREPEERRAARADSVENSAYVVHTRFQRRRAADAVGHARPARVKSDQTRERRKLLDRPSKSRQVPFKFEVPPEEARYPNEIERAVARDLIRDVNVSALYVVGVGALHVVTVSAALTQSATSAFSQGVAWRRRGFLPAELVVSARSSSRSSIRSCFASSDSSPNLLDEALSVLAADEDVDGVTPASGA